MIYKNFADSHLHLLPTGEQICGLNLRNHTSFTNLTTKEILCGERGGWIYGFGWDENRFENVNEISKSNLDRLFPNQPVLLSRCDGHASLLNSKALQVIYDKFGESLFAWNQDLAECKRQFGRGILKEKSHIMALQCLPEYQEIQLRQYLLAAGKALNRNGITHVRDMTAWPQTLAIANDMIAKGELKLAIGGYFVIEDMADLDRQIQSCQDHAKMSSGLVRCNGLKVFLDGSLGSRTAAMSMPYHDDSSLAKSESSVTPSGQLFFSEMEIAKLMRECFSRGLELSVHAIGNVASSQVAIAFERLTPTEKQQWRNLLHLEHAQVMIPSAVEIFGRHGCQIHMQPSHYLSDHSWLKTLIPDLQKQLFCWNDLETAGARISFGSDSPIEPADPTLSIKGVELASEHGIAKPKLPPLSYHQWHSHDMDCAQTELSNDRVKVVQFLGKRI